MTQLRHRRPDFWRLHAKSLRSLKELVEGAVREQMTRRSLESVGDVEAEVEAQCAKLCKRIGDEVAKSVCDGRSYW